MIKNYIKKSKYDALKLISSKKVLAKSLLIKLPNPPDKYNLQPVIGYYSGFTISVDFCLNNTSEEKVLKIMTNIESSKAAGIGRSSGRLLKVVPTY